MDFIRRFDQEKTVDTGYPGYRAQFLSHQESALMLVSHIAENGCGPSLHYHLSDQIYYLISGSMRVRLGDDVHEITSGTLVFIPAGLPHCNWNEGPGPETHFEILVPTPLPITPIAVPVDNAEDVPAEHRTDRNGYVVQVDPANFKVGLPGLRLQPLAHPGTGSTGAVIMYAEVDPTGEGPSTHVHDFDQYYMVLEGELTVEVGLKKHCAGPNTLVLLPAGVPHRQFNGGVGVEKHLHMLIPAPPDGEPWDRGVNFSATDEEHYGAFLFAP